MNCQICQQCQTKYKCPLCSIKYCSVQCYRTHKQNEQNSICEKYRFQQCEQKNEKKEEMEIEENELIKTDYIEDESLRISSAKLQKLKRNKKVKELLQNQSLREKILEIDNSKLRLNKLQNAMLDPTFMQFADEVLQMVKDSHQ